MDAHLQLNAQTQLIGPASAFAMQWAMNQGLSREESVLFATAVSELVTDIVLFAFPNNNSSTYDLKFRSTSTHIELIVSELGEPFDPDRYIYDPITAKNDHDFEGAGLKIMQSFCDDFVFINKGREGKEFRLVKELSLSTIDHLLLLTKTSPTSALDPEIEEYADIGEEVFDLQEVTVEDSEQIAKLIYRTYEYTYSKEEMYFPKKIEKTITRKNKFGVITRNKEGEAVGYFAIIKKEDSNIGEVGEAVVSPEYRRRGLMSEMLQKLIEIGKRSGLQGIFGKAVTHHPVSQKVNARYGFNTTALMLAETAMLKVKGLGENYPQHISLVIDYLPLQERKTRNVYLPEKYADILLQSYKQLSLSVDPNYRELEPGELAEKSAIDLVMNYSDATSLIVVDHYGRDFEHVLPQMVQSLEKRKKLATIYLDLPLENPATPSHFSILKDLGFIYSGLAPDFHHNSDFLRIQKTYIDLDFELIEIFSDFGKTIKKLVSNEYHQR